jgi:DNA repair protein RecO (recombination protein O)
VEARRACGFVVSRRERGETDLLLELLLEDGSVTRAIAKGAARSVKRFAGGLSPFTRYRFLFGAGRDGQLARIDEAVVERAHPGLLSDLRRTAAAGGASAVVRGLAADAGGEAALFELYAETLEALDHADGAQAGTALARFAVAALVRAGHPVVLDRCVRCGREAPDNARVTVSPVAGGVVCGRCGSGPLALSSVERRRLRATLAGDASAFGPEVLTWVASLVRAHAERAADVLDAAIAHWR